jgi:Peptidase family M1 domain
MRLQITLTALFIIFLTGCTGATTSAPLPVTGLFLVTANPRATATPTPFQPMLPTGTTSPLPPTDTATPLPPTLTLLPSATSLPPTATQPPATPQPVERTTYLLYTTMDYAGHSLFVDQQTAYTNHSSDTLYELVLGVEPNFWEGRFNLRQITSDGVPVNYNLQSHRLTVSLPQSLPPGGSTLLALSYDILLPYKSSGLVYGYTDVQANLVDWFPFIVPYQPGVGWLLHDVYPWGENLVYDASDFEVNLRFVDPYNPPVVAASAPAESNNEWTRYRLYNARTFAFSMSPYYLVSTEYADGTPVSSYYFSGHDWGGQAAASKGAQAVSVYAGEFGPYPYPSLSIVETGLPDGMEFDGMVFLSSAFFAGYDGTNANNLTMIGVHEIAHQWWFGLVGNDQTLEPWLDEAMATYSEHIFMENTTPGLLGWWWNTRVNFYEPHGWVDTTVYNGGSFRTYTNAVYLVGAYFIDAVRERIGDEAFFNFLKNYIVQMGHGRATADDWFRILRETTSTDISDIQSRYFQYSH